MLALVHLCCYQNQPESASVIRSRVNMPANNEDLVVSPTGIRLIPINLSCPDLFNEYNLPDDGKPSFENLADYSAYGLTMKE